MHVHFDDAIILMLPWIALLIARVLWALFVARSVRSLTAALQFRLSTLLAIMAFIPATFVLTNLLNSSVTSDHGDGFARRFLIGLPASVIVAVLTPIVWLIWQLTEDLRQPKTMPQADQEPSFSDWEGEGTPAAEAPAAQRPFDASRFGGRTAKNINFRPRRIRRIVVVP